MRGLSAIAALAVSTFRELIRSKVLYTTIFFAFAVIAIASCFGVGTIGDQGKIVKDFGLFAISFGSTMFIVVSGAALLNKELQRKTIYNILSKPVTRAQFLIGKFLGMFATTAIMVGMMAIMLLAFCFILEGSLDVLLLVGLVYMLLEISVICAAAIFFSALVVTPLLSGFFTLALFLCGRSAEYLLYFVKSPEDGSVLATVMRCLYWGLPNLAQLNISNLLVYGKTPTFDHLLFSLCYSVSYSCLLLLLAAMIFRKRDFN